MIVINKEARKFRALNEIKLREIAETAGVTKQAVCEYESKGFKSPKILGAYIRYGFIDYLSTMLINPPYDLLIRYQLMADENENDFSVWESYGQKLLADFDNGYFNNCNPRI